MGYGKALYRAKINRILEIMLLKNYGQTDLGSMSGLSASFISKVLSGSKVSLVSATKVATALGVQAKEIFTVNNEEYDLAQTQLETTGADIDEGVKLQICVKSSAYQVLEKQAEEKLVTISSYVENIIYEYIGPSGSRRNIHRVLLIFIDNVTKYCYNTAYTHRLPYRQFLSVIPE